MAKTMSSANTMILLCLLLHVFVAVFVSGVSAEKSFVPEQNDNDRSRRRRKARMNGSIDRSNQHRRRRLIGLEFPGSFSLIKANQPSNSPLSDILIGNYTNGTTISLPSATKVGMFIHTSNENYTSVVFSYDGNVQTEGFAPYSVAGNIGNTYFEIPYLFKDAGNTKVLNVKAYYGTSVYAELNFVFRIVLSLSPMFSPTPKPSVAPSTINLPPVTAAKVTLLPTSKPSVGPSTIKQPPVTATPTTLSPTLKPSVAPSTIKQPPVTAAPVMRSPTPIPSLGPSAIKQPPVTTVPVTRLPTPNPSLEPSAIKQPPVSTAPVTRLPTPNPSVAPSTIKVPPLSAAPIVKPTIPVLDTLPVMDPLINGTWKVVDMNAPIAARHEACFVMVGRVAVLLGGRGWYLRPNIYDPMTNTWREGSYPPDNIEVHHTQCVVVWNKLWVVGAWTGGFPTESNVAATYVYDPIADLWETKSALDNPRRRGSAAVVAVGDLIYVAFGNIGGHETADFAVSSTYLDVYNTLTDTWQALPSATFGRDHVGGGYVNGKICVAGGRDGGTIGWPSVGPTECYDIVKGIWSIEADVPVPRAGAAYGTSCDGKYLFMAGGEGDGIAHSSFDAFDGNKWIRLAYLNQARHGTGLAVDCVCNTIYIASGSGAPGNGMELKSVEKFYFGDATSVACS